MDAFQRGVEGRGDRRLSRPCLRDRQRSRAARRDARLRRVLSAPRPAPNRGPRLRTRRRTARQPGRRSHLAPRVAGALRRRGGRRRPHRSSRGAPGHDHRHPATAVRVSRDRRPRRADAVRARHVQANRSRLQRLCAAGAGGDARTGGGGTDADRAGDAGPRHAPDWRHGEAAERGDRRRHRGGRCWCCSARSDSSC